MDSISRAANIKQRLFVIGVSLSDIDRTHDLAPGTARDALRRPNEAGERGIAVALACGPHELWPERYDASGQRKSPQPPENYRRPPTMRQRQIAQGIST